jgi:hypothetical protein
MDIFKLSRTWFDFCFENPEKIKPNHSALYFFCIEHCNRLGWKEKFGLPTTMAKEAIGISSYNTYIQTLNDLVEWGFIKLIEKSKNQYSSNIIALSNYNKALDKALDKALIKHNTKHCKSTQQSTDSIDIQETINKKPETKIINWRTDFETYKKELRKAYKCILTPEYIIERENYHPNLDIVKTLEKACKDYWITEPAWKKKKASKTEEIDWKATFNNALTQKSNQVWKPRIFEQKPEVALPKPKKLI